MISFVSLELLSRLLLFWQARSSEDVAKIIKEQEAPIPLLVAMEGAGGRGGGGGVNQRAPY